MVKKHSKVVYMTGMILFLKSFFSHVQRSECKFNVYQNAGECNSQCKKFEDFMCLMFFWIVGGGGGGNIKGVGEAAFVHSLYFLTFRSVKECSGVPYFPTAVTRPVIC